MFEGFEWGFEREGVHGRESAVGVESGEGRYGCRLMAHAYVPTHLFVYLTDKNAIEYQNKLRTRELAPKRVH